MDNQVNKNADLYKLHHTLHNGYSKEYINVENGNLVKHIPSRSRGRVVACIIYLFRLFTFRQITPHTTMPVLLNSIHNKLDACIVNKDISNEETLYRRNTLICIRSDVIAHKNQYITKANKLWKRAACYLVPLYSWYLNRCLLPVNNRSQQIIDTLDFEITRLNSVLKKLPVDWYTGLPPVQSQAQPQVVANAVNPPAQHQQPIADPVLVPVVVVKPPAQQQLPAVVVKPPAQLQLPAVRIDPLTQQQLDSSYIEYIEKNKEQLTTAFKILESYLGESKSVSAIRGFIATLTNFKESLEGFRNSLKAEDSKVYFDFVEELKNRNSKAVVLFDLSFETLDNFRCGVFHDKDKYSKELIEIIERKVFLSHVEIKLLAVSTNAGVIVDENNLKKHEGFFRVKLSNLTLNVDIITKFIEDLPHDIKGIILDFDNAVVPDKFIDVCLPLSKLKKVNMIKFINLKHPLPLPEKGSDKRKGFMEILRIAHSTEPTPIENLDLDERETAILLHAFFNLCGYKNQDTLDLSMCDSSFFLYGLNRLPNVFNITFGSSLTNDILERLIHNHNLDSFEFINLTGCKDLKMSTINKLLRSRDLQKVFIDSHVADVPCTNSGKLIIKKDIEPLENKLIDIINEFQKCLKHPKRSTLYKNLIKDYISTFYELDKKTSYAHNFIKENIPEDPIAMILPHYHLQNDRLKIVEAINSNQPIFPLLIAPKQLGHLLGEANTEVVSLELVNKFGQPMLVGPGNIHEHKGMFRISFQYMSLFSEFVQTKKSDQQGVIIDFKNADMNIEFWKGIRELLRLKRNGKEVIPLCMFENLKSLTLPFNELDAEEIKEFSELMTRMESKKNLPIIFASLTASQLENAINSFMPDALSVDFSEASITAVSPFLQKYRGSKTLIMPRDTKDVDLVELNAKKCFEHLWKLDVSISLELTSDVFHLLVKMPRLTQVCVPANIAKGNSTKQLSIDNPFLVLQLYENNPHLWGDVMKQYTGPIEYAYIFALPMLSTGNNFNMYASQEDVIIDPTTLFFLKETGTLAKHPVSNNVCSIRGDFNPKLEDKDIPILMTRFPKTRSLSLRGCEGITNDAFGNLIVFKYLTRLDLTGTKVTQEFVANIKAIYPDLEVYSGPVEKAANQSGKLVKMSSDELKDSQSIYRVTREDAISLFLQHTNGKESKSKTIFYRAYVEMFHAGFARNIELDISLSNPSSNVFSDLTIVCQLNENGAEKGTIQVNRDVWSNRSSYWNLLIGPGGPYYTVTSFDLENKKEDKRLFLYSNILAVKNFIDRNLNIDECSQDTCISLLTISNILRMPKLELLSVERLHSILQRCNPIQAKKLMEKICFLQASKFTNLIPLHETCWKIFKVELTKKTASTLYIKEIKQFYELFTAYDNQNIHKEKIDFCDNLLSRRTADAITASEMTQADQPPLADDDLDAAIARSLELQ